MGQRSYAVLVGRGLAVALLLGAGIARAGTFDVTINSPSLFGSPAVLVFDFTDGGPPDNTVLLSTLTSNGTQGSTSIVGNINDLGGTGIGPWTFSDAPVPADPSNPSSFNELQVTFGPMGSLVSFSFTTTDNPPDGGSFPDAFSFFILNPDQSFLVTTDDPTGANALFLYSIGQGADGLSVFTADLSEFSFTVTPAQAAPEPASLALLAAGLAALSTRRRHTR